MSANVGERAAAHAPVIGIAGGIGSGKSRVAAALASRGCIVSNADDHVREILAREAIRDELVEWWGDRVVTDEGLVDRRAVAGIVFADAAQLRRLEDLLHPLVESARRALWAAHPGATAYVIDAPLLFEVGLDEHCDAVIFVETARETRLARVTSTRGWDDAELSRREDSQLPLDVKRSRADYVIGNDSSPEDLDIQVGRTLQIILDAT